MVALPSRSPGNPSCFLLTLSMKGSVRAYIPSPAHISRAGGGGWGVGVGVGWKRDGKRWCTANFSIFLDAFSKKTASILWPCMPHSEGILKVCLYPKQLLPQFQMKSIEGAGLTSCSSRGPCRHLLANVGIYTPIVHINQNLKKPACYGGTFL